MFLGSVVGISLLLAFYQHVPPIVFASLRVGVLLLLVLRWRQVVELLISYKLIHPMRNDVAIAFRWRFCTLVAMLELLVIQQVPALLWNPTDA